MDITNYKSHGGDYCFQKTETQKQIAITSFNYCIIHIYIWHFRSILYMVILLSYTH